MTTTTTLADAFLQDFDDSGDEDTTNVVEEEKIINDNDINATVTIERSNIVLDDDKFRNFMKNINMIMNEQQQMRAAALSSVDYDRHHELIVKANQYNVQIDNEANVLYKNLLDIYGKKIKDLEQIVTNPVDYARVVKRIGNETDVTKINLSDILPQHVILTLSVTASAAVGKNLSDSEMEHVVHICDNIIALNDAKIRVFKFVESRMLSLAPNLCAIVGAEMSARLLSVAGGLNELANIPSCNVQVLGAERGDLGGFSSTASQPHFGILSNCDLIQRTPNEFKVRALRIVSAKCVLAARIDSYCDEKNQNVESGRKFRENIEKKMEKWLQPLEHRMEKALPKPITQAKKRRGGRRARKRKGLTEKTELQKLRNRVMFGKAEYSDDYTGESFGMIGVAGSGSLRAAKKTKQNVVSNANKKALQRVNGGKISGLVSTIAMTPTQGMELVNPNALEERKAALAAANSKYFSSTSGFFNVKKSS